MDLVDPEHTHYAPKSGSAGARQGWLRAAFQAPRKVSPATHLPDISFDDPPTPPRVSNSVPPPAECSRVWAAGDNAFGQLGLGRGMACSPSPRQVQLGPLCSPQAGRRVVSVACGMRHSLLLLSRPTTSDPHEAEGTDTSCATPGISLGGLDPGALDACAAAVPSQGPVLQAGSEILGFGSNRRLQLGRQPRNDADTPQPGPPSSSRAAPRGAVSGQAGQRKPAGAAPGGAAEGRVFTPVELPFLRHMQVVQV